MSGRRAAWTLVLAVMVVGLSIGASTASAQSSSTESAAIAQDGGGGGAIAEALLAEAGKGVLSSAAGFGVSYALKAMGVGGEADTAKALAEIKALLERANTQLTSLRDESAAIRDAVLNSDYNSGVRQALPIINSVNHAEKLLIDATNETGPNQVQDATDAAAYIKANLLDKVSLLYELAFGAGPASATSIYGAAVKVRTADSFLTHSDSVGLRYLVDYYAGYIAAAAQLTATYGVAHNYSSSKLSSILNDATTKVTHALSLRRDAVPQNIAVDVRMPKVMWWTKFYGVTTHPKLIETDFFASLFFAGVKGQSGLSGWRMPSKDEMTTLIKGWNGSPGEWIAKNGGFATTDGVGDNPAFWTGTGTDQGVELRGVRLWLFWYVRMSDGLVDTLSTGHDQRHGYMAVRDAAENYVPGT